MYWNAKLTLSHNALFNFIIGPRGAGKTFGALTYGIEKFLKYGHEFLYVRRFGTELTKLTESKNGRIFKAIDEAKVFSEYQLKASSNVLYCSGKVMGYAQSLTTAGIVKSDTFPKVKLIIFDEFIIDNRGSYHYLKDEVEKFLELYETIARLRNDVLVLFLSNAVSVNNPYFEYFQLDKPKDGVRQKFGKSKDILVENCVNAEFVELKKQSRIGQLLEGTAYSEYAYENKWLLDNNDFIEQKTQRSNYYCTLRYKENYLGIWFDSVQYRFYVSDDVEKSSNKIYSTTTDDHQPNTLLFYKGKKLPILKNLIDAYECGAIYYESQKLKNWFRQIMRMRA